MGETPQKQYESVGEFSGQDFMDGVRDFFDDVVKTVRKLIREGDNCRVRLVNKDGEDKFSTTVTVGTAGLIVVAILAPFATILLGLGVLLTEHRIIIEKEKLVDGPPPESSPAEAPPAPVS